MARFNPPPGWPAFPDGWIPPAGWQPDPHWPRPPDGWQWWVVEPAPAARHRRGAAGGREARRPAAHRAPPDPVRPSATLRSVSPSAAVVPRAAIAVTEPAPAVTVTITPDALAGWLLAVAGLIVVIGSLLPWVSAGMSTASGTSGDGVITLVLGLLTVAAGAGVAVRRRRWAATGGLAVALASVAVALIDIEGIASEISIGMVGAGLWVTAIGAVLAVAVSVVSSTLLGRAARALDEQCADPVRP